MYGLKSIGEEGEIPSYLTWTDDRPGHGREIHTAGGVDHTTNN